MENFNVFLDYIARTNLFNFAIFFSIIVFLIKKINVRAKLEKAQESVQTTIVDSESVKVKSDEKLRTIEESMANIEQEIDDILSKSETNAKLVGEKILQEGQKSVLAIRENSNKAIENSRMILKNELLKRASLASIEVAKTHIINELSWNQGLHDKLIDESLDSIGGLEL